MKVVEHLVACSAGGGGGSLLLSGPLHSNGLVHLCSSPIPVLPIILVPTQNHAKQHLPEAIGTASV